MSEYDFILDNMRFSYSSITTFETCPYSFKLTYIEALPRANNFFAEYGLLVHDCLENYFNGKLESYELSQYYLDNFEKFVKTDPPIPPFGLYEKYKQQGKDYFDNFFFPKMEFESIGVEDKIDFIFKGVQFTARPDLVLKKKKTGKYYLYDYKTSVPFRFLKSGVREDEAKMEGYKKQLYTYAYALRNISNIPIEGMEIWFPRANRSKLFVWNEKEEQKIMNWIVKTIKNIKKEENFPYNNSSSFFCDNLCSVRDFCEFR